MIIADIQTIYDSNDRFDAEITAFHDTLCETHSHMDDFLPTVIDADSGGEECEHCGCAAIVGWNLHRETRERICKNCIVSIKMNGIAKLGMHGVHHDHDSTDRVCVECHVDFDSRGYPMHQYHQMMKLSPSVNGRGITEPGLLALIDEGEVELDEPSGLLIIRGEVVKIKQRMPSKLWRQAFHCNVKCGTDIITDADVGPTLTNEFIKKHSPS